jgi:hypothetical protein
MKAAVIFSVPMSTAKRFGWSWRSEDRAQGAAAPFASHADCVADAQRNGYTVGLDRLRTRSDLAATSFGKVP